MGEAEQHQYTSLSARIAALNPQHLGGNLPPHPTRPPTESTSNAPTISSITSPVIGHSNHEPIGLHNVLPAPVTKPTANEQIRPPLPERLSTGPPLISSTNGTVKPAPILPPSLPPRLPPKPPKPSSNESSGPSSPCQRPSTASTTLRTLPPSPFEATLPPLPPSRRDKHGRKLSAEKAYARPMRPVIHRVPPAFSAESLQQLRTLTNNPPPPLPRASLPLPRDEPKPDPGFPSRRNTAPPPVIAQDSSPSQQNVRKPPPPPPKRPSLALGTNRLVSNEEVRVTNEGAVPPDSVSESRFTNKSNATPNWFENPQSRDSLPSQHNVRKLPPPFTKLPDSFDEVRSTNQSNQVTPVLNDKPPSRQQSIVNPSPAVPRASRLNDSGIGQIPQADPSLRPLEKCCLKCRDFSYPDRIAAQYPRASIQNLKTEYLAQVLCGPFSSHTDKARAIFAWIHHNIAYDTVGFFAGKLPQPDPETTLARGLAICGGYATLFHHIAILAGLECVHLSGHGKGFGYKDLMPGEKIPPYSSTHAWNAVKIDGGEWKLIDSCWGAGSLEGRNFVKRFNTSQFTDSNEDFGLKHYPSDDSEFFRNDGLIPTWEQYYVGFGPPGCQNPKLYGLPSVDHGIDPTSFLPSQKVIEVSQSERGSLTRFQCSNICEHWDVEVHGAGKPYLIGILINGASGRGFKRIFKKLQFVPLENKGFLHTVDIETTTLGAKGQKVQLGFVKTKGGKDARGMTSREYKLAEYLVPMGYELMAEWELA